MKNVGDWRPARLVGWLLTGVFVGLLVAFYIIVIWYRLYAGRGDVPGGIAGSALILFAGTGLFALLYWLASRKKSWFGE